MRRRNILAVVGIGPVLLLFACASETPVYKNPQASLDARVKDLLARMTPEEKFWQLFMIPGDLGEDPSRYEKGLFGFQVSSGKRRRDSGAEDASNRAGRAPAVEAAEKIDAIQRFFIERTRLGIPIIPFDEALHGLVREGAVAYPQSIGLAATFDPDLVRRVAGAIAFECRSRGIRQVLSPVVNIASDVRWGRVEETYGEDPFLSSEMGLAFVSAFEALGVIATPKHFVANVGDGGRDSYPVHQNERWLREIVLPPFEACLRRGGARSIMTAYNSLDGTPCSSNAWLLRRLLKGEWGFRGFAISDASAVGGANALHLTASGYEEAGRQALEGGLDVIFQTSYDHHELFIRPFLDGRIDRRTIDAAVGRVLRAKFELGLFEDPSVDPDEAGRRNGQAGHRALALEAARKSIVLLKNENSVLPLAKTIRSLAVIGPDAEEARLGGYSGPGIQKTSILDGIKAKLGPAAEVVYARGCGRRDEGLATVPADRLSCFDGGVRKPGLKGEYFSGIGLQDDPAFVRIDPRIDFQWTLYSPDPENLAYDFYSIRWTGRLESPVTGTHRIGIEGNDGYRLFVDGRLLIDNWIKRSHRIVTAEVPLRKGQEIDLRLEYFEPTGNARLKLVWDVEADRTADRDIKEAVRLASRCQAAVIVAGIGEGEFRDRARLSLPGRQGELIRRVVATGKPVVVVLVAGSAVTMEEWLDRVPAVLAVWYPGEEGGNAVADVLFGDTNPSGRLPITFPVSEGQVPLVYNHKPTGRGDDYLDLTGQPLFPFGYGLSYTKFEYVGLTIDKPVLSAGERTAVRFRVKNGGGREGEEVVQLYVHDLLASVARPVIELKGIRKAALRPGEEREISFEITPETLMMLDKNLKPVVEPGEFRLMIGSSSKDIRLSTTLKVL
jgi:beta-glucosidase